MIKSHDSCGSRGSGGGEVTRRWCHADQRIQRLIPILGWSAAGNWNIFFSAILKMLVCKNANKTWEIQIYRFDSGAHSNVCLCIFTGQWSSISTSQLYKRTRSYEDVCSTGSNNHLLQIFLDHRSLSSIDQKILMTPTQKNIFRVAMLPCYPGFSDSAS